jgi:hypothetical protein
MPIDRVKQQVVWICSLTLLAPLAPACTRPCSCASEQAAATPTAGGENSVRPGNNAIDLVGLWRGYWSPARGSVETERYLFLPDGRWGWLAMSKEVNCLERGVTQRAGRWSLQGDRLVLEEKRRKEITGCKENASFGSDKGINRGGVDSAICREPEVRSVSDAQASIENIAVGQCPPNQEAEEQDTGYACLSIGGKAFWRYHGREKVDEETFLGTK